MRLPSTLALSLLVTIPLLAQSTAPARPHITGISHVAYYVTDMPRALVFWHDLLGFDLSYDRKDDRKAPTPPPALPSSRSTTTNTSNSSPTAPRR